MFYTLGPLEWKRYIDDIFSLWNVDRKEIEELIVLANSRYPTMKFTAEISDKKINFYLLNPPWVRKGSTKGLSAKSFAENITQFKTRLAV